MRRNALLTGASFTLGASALAFALVVAAFRLFFPGTFLTVTAPLARASSAVSAGVSRVASSFADSQALRAQNDAYRSENAQLAEANRALSEQVARLSGLLGDTQQKSTHRGIVAQVSVAPPASAYDTFVVAAGSDDGVTRGMIAFGAGGVPVGAVTAVTRAYARVTAFSAPGMQLSGWVGAAHVPVTLTGEGAGAFYASVPRSASTTVGDLIFTALGGPVPIASVVGLGTDISAPVVALRVRPTTNPLQATVLVLRDVGATAAFSFATSSLP